MSIREGKGRAMNNFFKEVIEKLIEFLHHISIEFQKKAIRNIPDMIYKNNNNNKGLSEEIINFNENMKKVEEMNYLFEKKLKILI